MIRGLVVLCMGVVSVVSSPTRADTTLMLACRGTATIKSGSAAEYDPDPVSVGLIVDFTNRTVQGTARWGPYLFDDQLQITEWNEVTVVFRGFSKFLGRDIAGYMDRVTGDVGMVATAKDSPGAFDYALKCKPTRRVLE